MSQCVEIVGGAVVESAVSPCPGFVLLTPAEYGSFVSSPFYLTAEDGFIVSVGIIGVWVIAWCFKALVRALDTDGEAIER